MTEERVLYAIVCAAAPAGGVGHLVEYAQRRRWEVRLVATEMAARHFLDMPELERCTGYPVRTTYRHGGPGRMPDASAVVVAPATYNTINKWAAGIVDSFPLTLLAELTGLGLPIAVLPFVSTAFGANGAFRRSVEWLRADGVRVLLGPGGVEPYPPGACAALTEEFPWPLAVDAVDDASGTQGSSPAAVYRV